MNEDAQKWIYENCDEHNERMIAAQAMRWAYADAARICLGLDDDSDGNLALACKQFIEARAE